MNKSRCAAVDQTFLEKKHSPRLIVNEEKLETEVMMRRLCVTHSFIHSFCSSE